MPCDGAPLAAGLRLEISYTWGGVREGAEGAGGSLTGEVRQRTIRRLTLSTEASEATLAALVVSADCEASGQDAST